MQDLWTALALVLVIEGVLYALFPQPMKRAMLAVLTQPEPTLRLVGLAAVLLGVGFVWVIRHH
ncbi:MAG TPA: DUF2065 domain-containing protein [Aliidongia sp.]|nr:DUF2065 domain-containing protein [Aliidongia sp.]